MYEVKFEWDNHKAGINIGKHKVSFEEALTVFSDPLAFIFDDETHSVNEKREIIIGHSENNRLLPVCFTEQAEDIVRIFSSRPATRKERRDYEKNTIFQIG
ncbi:MAG: BrnT family toxin [Desulfococcaceae bacterium]